MDHDLFIIHGVEENPPQGKTWDPVKRNISKLWGMHGYQDDSRGPQKHGWPHTISLPFAAGCNQLIVPYNLSCAKINYVNEGKTRIQTSPNDKSMNIMHYNQYKSRLTNAWWRKPCWVLVRAKPWFVFLSTLTWVNCLPPKNGMPGSWHSSMTNAPFYFACYMWYNPE